MLKSYVRGEPLPEHLAPLYKRFNPTEKQLAHANPWTDVKVDAAPGAVILATGYDVAGRLQRIYSPEHVASAKAGKFERVRALLTEWEDIRTQIESTINAKATPAREREAATVAYLIYETGIRPGSGSDPLAKVPACGALGLQLRHVKIAARGVRLKFIGKKGVAQNVLVTNPYLSRLFKARKADDPRWSRRLFRCSGSALSSYFKELGSGDYTPKDFRTARGTSLALELLGSRNRLPKAASKRKAIVNDALDRVAKLLGNTRAVSRSAYVDPSILERFAVEGTDNRPKENRS